MIQFLPAIISGVTTYFSNRQEISKLKHEGRLKVIEAETQGRIEQVKRESEQDYNYNMEMVKQMKNSWKDEFVLLIVSAPAVMLFIPDLQDYAINGFAVMAHTVPVWYQVLLLGIYFSTYGLKDIFKIVLQLILGKVKK